MRVSELRRLTLQAKLTGVLRSEDVELGPSWCGSQQEHVRQLHPKESDLMRVVL